jgi:hypothetical protein
MEKVIELRTRVHDAAGVLADFARILEEEPECMADGVVVLMLSRGADGDRYDLRQLSSHMRRMDLVGLYEAAKHDQLHRALDG